MEFNLFILKPLRMDKHRLSRDLNGSDKEEWNIYLYRYCLRGCPKPAHNLHLGISLIDQWGFRKIHTLREISGNLFPSITYY